MNCSINLSFPPSMCFPLFSFSHLHSLKRLRIHFNTFRHIHRVYGEDLSAKSCFGLLYHNLDAMARPHADVSSRSNLIYILFCAASEKISE